MIQLVTIESVNGDVVTLNTDQIPINSFTMDVSARTDDVPKVQDHGEWESFDYYGVRSFAFEGSIFGNNAADYMQRRLSFLKAFISDPTQNKRWSCRLKIRFDGIAEELTAICNITGGLDAPMTGLSPSRSDFQLTLVAMDPRMYSSQEQVAATDTPDVFGGFGSPMTSPLIATGVTAGGQINVLNNGNAPSYPTVEIQGPAVNPEISLIRNGVVYTVETEGLVISAAETITIDMSNKIIYGSSGGSIYNKIKGVPDWFALYPGNNVVRYSSSAASPPSRAVFHWNNAYMI
jgi:hypothetical protein